MNLSVGIIGLPNVGKSTLFNALLKKQAALVANYPFATIEPNVGIVPVPDTRLEVLANIIAGIPVDKVPPFAPLKEAPFEKRPPIVPATVRFVDIAGLVKGAHEGAGLGNKFLLHIREVSVIAHVVRAFTDKTVVRYEDTVDPRPLKPELSDGERAKSDYTTIRTELQLADLETLEKQKEPKGTAPKEEQHRWNTIVKIQKALNEGKDANAVVLTDEEKREADQLFLLSAKPEIVVLNAAEDDYTESKIIPIVNQYTSILVIPKENIVVISAKIEAELAALSEQEQKEYLASLGLKESGLERLIKKAYETLGLISFLTAPSNAHASEEQGAKWEVRAWTIRRGSTALQASGEIHTDFIKNFIKAEVVSYDDFVKFGGWKKVRELGKTRFEGKDYIVQDGDVIEFKIGR